MTGKHGFALTKNAPADGGGYKISGTPFIVVKAPPAKYGFPQEWDVVGPDHQDFALVTGTSLSNTLWKLSELRAVFTQPATL